MIVRRWQREAQRTAETTLGVVLLALSVASPPEEAGAAYVDYVYVDSNEGQASGGHVAIAFGGQTFHFQHREGGLILPTRHATGAFEHAYRIHGNRNLRVHRIEVEDETYTMLRDGFNARYFESEVALSELRRLAEERKRFTAPNARKRRIPVPGAGFFYPDGDAPPHVDGASPIARLRSQLEPRLPFPRGATPRGESDRLADLLSREALERGAVLRPTAVFAAGGGEALRGAASRASLRTLLEQLEAQVGALLESSRPDAGEALFLAMARYAAVSRSLAEGRLLVLDSYPADAETISVPQVEARGGQLDELLEATRNEFAKARAVLDAGAALDEIDFSRLEDSANRLREIERANRVRGGLRVVRERMIPQRTAYRSAAGVSFSDTDNPADALARNRARADSIRKTLREESAYNLVTRNCVSEVFRTLEELLAGKGTDAAASRAIARLGGHVAGGESFNFIPFVSADAVAESYRISETIELPSHRNRTLAEIYAHEGEDLSVYLRESNTLTSTVYRRNAEDSIFLFFTDDAVALRPIYGALNFLTGIGATILGVPLIPFDGGRLFSAGARGAFWSLPELAFVNVRKGSFFFVPRTQGNRLKTGSNSPAERPGTG
jgi:hypothetical protein